MKNMKKYIEPAIKVKEIELEDMIAGSPELPAQDELDQSDENQLDQTDIEAKKFGNVSSWDD